jgi:hypothetical protein
MVNQDASRIGKDPMKAVMSKAKKKVRKIIAGGPGEPRLFSADFRNEFGEDLVAEFLISGDRREIATTIRCPAPNEVPPRIWMLLLAQANIRMGEFATFSIAPGRTLAVTNERSVDEFLDFGLRRDQKPSLSDLPDILTDAISLAEKATAEMVAADQDSYRCDA